MIKISLFCAGGMSTSVLVSKMKKAAEDKGIETEIQAFPEAQMAKKLEGLDVVLLGPQVAYILPKAKKICDEKGVPIAVISNLDYGMMDGAKVLDFALKLVKKN
jgi:PTS system cellobiose-specific IIB component